jgi:hypothetical protein
MNILSDLASILTISECMVTFVHYIKRISDSLKPYGQIDFYFLTFYALFSAAAGGLIWNVACISFGKVGLIGGPGYEPHGILAVIWPIATLSAVLMTLFVLNLIYHFMDKKYQLLNFLVFLISVSIGSAIFYDLPLFGSQGFRNYFEAMNMTFVEKEIYLVLIWSLIISLLGFLPLSLIKIKNKPKSVSTQSIIFSMIEQVGFCVGLTTSAVLFCLLPWPNEVRLDAARGVIVGLALRMSLFFGLIVACLPVLPQITPAYMVRVQRIKSFFLRSIIQ